MSEVEQQAAAVTGPKENQIAVLACGTSSDADDLSIAANLGALASAGKFVSIISDQLVYFRFSDATGTADETATTGATRVHMLPANTERRYRLPRTDAGLACTWLIHKAAGSGHIRVAITDDGRY